MALSKILTDGIKAEDKCNYSKIEIVEMCDFEINSEIIHPYILDMYSEEYKFAIEYDELLYNSEGTTVPNKDNMKKYHLNKTELCEEKNIQLFHIFENEWNNKKDIWKSVINSKLHKTNRVYARKCVVKEVDSKLNKEFLDKNHLQGSINAPIRLGLYYNDELLQLMTFGKSRYNKSIEYELIRMCSKLNTTVIGGASKLLKYFERNYKPESIISYANRRWSEGNVYEKLGFEWSHNALPNYFYFKNNDILYSRNVFQKHKLKNKLDTFDSELTEKQNMFNNDYRRIFDSGNKVYVKKYIGE